MNGGGALRETGLATATLTLRRAVPQPPPEAPRDLAADAAELRRLAVRFAELAPEQAHELFTEAFGLYSARHFGAAPRPADADLATVSWWHGPTVHRSAPRARRERRRAGAVVLPSARRGGGRHRKGEAGALPAGRPLPTDQERQAAERQAAERRAAARLLLARPLVTAGGPGAQALGLIQRHARWLTERFAELLGYPLLVGERFARLVKSPLAPGEGEGRGLPGFTPDRYAALAGALAEVLVGPPWWAEARPLPAGLPETVTEAAWRAAVEQLTDWQVLGPVAEQGPTGEQELGTGSGRRVDVELAAALAARCRPVGPQDPPAPRTTIPVAVRRRLAESPLLLLGELTALEREWLLESRQREAAGFAEFLGLATEIRREGFALLDPADELTDLRLPGPDPLAHTALLLVERLVDQLRPLPDEPTPVAVPIAEALIDGLLGDIADEHGADRAQLADRAAFRRQVLALLHRMRLIAPGPCPSGTADRTGWALLAPAARYAAELDLAPAPGTGRHSRR
ncbi:DUF2398 family protein [Streptomyces tateyamensis]|uniref:DUF2398 family protein n=1 Tax=Streptomyces tateyamensis TaxID=565073 RepID=UPI0015E89521|nr:DUF2398 family protein [Streptomyces tateyamensis]